MSHRVVFLHALPLDGSMWKDAAARLHVESTIAPTLYGLGESLEDWAAGVLDLAGDGPLVVVGNSVGGSCALEIARLAPDRVVAVVLVGAKAAHRPEPQFRDEAIQLLAEGGMEMGWPRYWAPRFGATADPTVVEAARRNAFAQDIEDVIRGVRVFHSRPDRSTFARTWDKPLVVVSGDQDLAPSRAATLAATARNGEFHLVQDSGHYVPLEQPDALAPILRQVVHAAS
jgi:pimeloyl-ACP methyl ester carboxylesterase